jgi:hypothetical protein
MSKPTMVPRPPSSATCTFGASPVRASRKPSVEGIEARSNFGSAYTAVNGSMYSMVSEYGVVGIRLPAAARPTALARRCTAATLRGRRLRSRSRYPMSCLPMPRRYGPGSA